MDRIKEERKKKAREYYLKNKDNPESSIYKRRQAKKDAVKASKGKYGHRAIEELKGFIKRYNKHFQIKISGKSRKQLEDAIDEGMKKKVDGDLRQAHERLLAPKQKVKSAAEFLKEQKEAQKKEEPKKTKKVIKIKIEKPKRTSFKKPSGRVEIGEINKGKIVKADTSKSKPVSNGKSPSKPSALPPRKNRKPAKSQPVPSGKSPSKPIGETKKERRRRLNEKIEQLKRGEAIVGKN